MQSKNAIGNLINKYRAVLKKCTLLNTFGTLAVLTALSTGMVGMLDVSCSHARSLNDVTEDISAPDEIVTSGDLSTAVNAIFAGVAGLGQVSGFNDTQGFPASLTLTGLGTTGGVLSTSNLQVLNAATLILGVETSPVTVINGHLIASGAYQRGAGNPYYSTAEVQYTDLTVAGGVLVEKSARLYINDGASLTAEFIDISLNGGGTGVSATPTLYVGAFGNDGSGKGDLRVTGADGIQLNDGQMYVGDGSIITTKIVGEGVRSAVLVGSVRNAGHKGTLTVTGEEGIDFSTVTGGSIFVSNGTMNTPTISITNGARVRVGETDNTYTTGTLNITGAAGLVMDNEAYFDTLYGVANISAIHMTNGAFVRVGSEETHAQVSAQINVAAAGTHDTADFVQPTFLSDGQVQSAFGKIAIGSVGTYNIDNHLTLGTSAPLNIAGTLAANSISLGGNLIIDGGTLRAAGDLTSSAGGSSITIRSNTAQIVRGETIYDNQLNAGALELAANGAAILGAQVIVDDANASLLVSSGSWTAQQAISVQQGSLVVKNASLDTSGTTLSAASGATVNLSGGTLTATLADFGSVDLTQASGSEFMKNTANMAPNIMGDAGTFLTLTGFSSALGLTLTEYNILKEEVTNEIFGLGNTVGGVTLQGITLNVPGLSGIAADMDAPTESLVAGTLTHNVTAIVGSILLSDTSTINAGSLTLTGLGADAVLSEGAIHVQGGALTLGYASGGAFGGLQSPEKTIVSGAISATGATSSVTVNHTHTTIAGGVDLKDKATFTVTDTGGVTTPSFVMDDATATVDGSLTVTDTGMTLQNGAVLHSTGIGTDSVSTTKLVMDNAHMTAGNALTVSGDDGISLKNGASLTVSATQANTASSVTQISFDKGTALTVGDGIHAHTLTTSEMTFVDEDSEDEALVTTSSIAIKNNANLTLNDSFIVDVERLTEAQGVGKIAVENGATFYVTGTLSLAGSEDTTTGAGSTGTGESTSIKSTNFSVGGVVAAGNINISANQLNVLKGTLRSYGGAVTGGDIVLDGGHMELASGSSSRVVSSNVTLKNTASTLNFTGGDWQIDNTVTVQDGQLNIMGGNTVTSFLHSTITMTGGAFTVGGGSELIVLGDLNISGGVANISGGALTANISHFGSIDLSAASGSMFEKVTGAEPEDGVHILLDTDGATELVLTGFESTTVLSPEVYTALLQEVLRELTGEELAILTIEGINFNVSSFSLSDVSVPMSQADATIRAGEFGQQSLTTGVGVTATFAGIVPNDTTADASVAHKDAVLKLTGLGDANGIISQGNIDILAGTLQVGISGKSATAVEMQGNISATGAESALLVQGTSLGFVEGSGIFIKDGAQATIATNARVGAHAFEVDNASVTVNGTVSLENGQDINISNGGALHIDGGTVNTHVLEATDSNITVSAGGLLNIHDNAHESDANATVSKGSFTANKSTVTVEAGGTVRLSKYTLTDSQFHVGGTVELVGDHTINVNSVGVSGGSEDFVLQSEGLMQSTGTLTLERSNAGDTLNTAGTLAAEHVVVSGSLEMVQGTVKALGGSVKGDAITVNGGVLELAAGLNTEEALLENAVTVNTGSVTVSGGIWNAGQDMSLNGGALEVNGGTLKSSGLTVTGTASVSVKNGLLSMESGALSVANTATVIVQKGGTLAAQLSDFGTVTGMTFDDSTGSVKSDIHSYAGSNLILQGATGTLSLNDYGTLIGSAVTALFDATTTQNTGGGAITLDGISVDVSQSTLADITANMGLNVGDQDIGAGTLNAQGAHVTFSHVREVAGSHDVSVVLGTVTFTGSASSGTVGSGSFATTAADGAIYFGSQTAQTAQSLTVGGSVTANTGTVGVQNTALTVQGNVTVNNGGTFTVGEGASLIAEQNVNIGDSTAGAPPSVMRLANMSSLTAKTVNLSEGSQLLVGDGTQISPDGAHFTAQEVSLNGGMIVFDPAWPIAFHEGAEITNASSGAIARFTAGIDGGLIVGQHSTLVLGDTATQNASQYVQEAFRRTGLTWGPNDISAALFISQAQDLDVTKGSIIVNGALTAAPASTTGGDIVFADNSVLMVDAGNITTKAPISVTGGTEGKLAVADSAQLFIENGGNDTYTIVDNVTITDALNDGTGGTVAGGVWDVTNVHTTSSAVYVQGVEYNDEDKAFDVTLRYHSVAPDYPMMQKSMLDLVDGLVLGAGPDTNSDNMGIRFISRAIDTNYLGRTQAERATVTLEGAVQMAVVGAVPTSTLNTSQLMTSAIIERTSLTRPVNSRLVSTQDAEAGISAGSDTGADTGSEASVETGSELAPENWVETTVKSHPVGVWLMPLYHSSSGSGFESGNFSTGYKSDITGLAVGADVNFNDYLRIGMALNMGMGTSNSTGDFNDTRNNFDFWGVVLYAGLQHENFGLTFDLGYNINQNDLTQSLPAAMGMSDLSGSVTSSAWSAGIRAEYVWQTAYLDITPHIGLRHTVLNSGKYKIQSGNGDVFHAEASNQSLTTIPVGLSFSKEWKFENGWSVSPKLDLGYVLTLGDLEATSRVSVPSVYGNTMLNMETFDKHAFTGGLGVELQKNALSFGLNYNTQISERKTDHALFGFVRFEFGGEDMDTGLSGGTATEGPTFLPLIPVAEESTETAGGENASAEGNVDVHTLAPVEVRGIEIGSGSYSIRGEVLRTLPNASGTVTGALKSMSNVQFSNTEHSSQQGGEIAPPRISIYGSKPYENSFLVDGLNVSNTLNPSGFEGSSNGNHVGGPNYLVPGGGDQDIFYDTQLIEQITVHTNNVPAKYGNFSGGVVDASLRDPRTDEWHFRIAGKHTSSSWYEVRDANSSSETSASQPKFDIYNLSATAEGPISDTMSLLLGYSNRHSFIPLMFEDDQGNVSEKNQYRLSQNFFGKLVFTPTSDLTLRFDASYAPYEDLRWRENWPDSEQTMFNDAIRMAFQAEYNTDAGDFEFGFSYLRSGFSIDADSSFIEQDQSQGIRRGGYGSRDITKNEFASNFDYISPIVRNDWLQWKVEAGVDVNITGVRMWAEETRTNIVVAQEGSPHILTTNALYPETDQYNTMTTLGLYVQGEFVVERFTFTPGFRIDTDNMTSNVDISPRLKLEIDTFDNDMLRLVAGYNRYYGTALREYAFSRYRQFQNTQHYYNTDTGVTTTNYSLGASRDYDIAGLQTPYSDEYTFGILGTVWGIDYTLDYTIREHKNQLISEETGQQLVYFNGRNHTQSVYELTNKGYSNYQGITLTLGRSFDFGSTWGTHYVGFGATVAKTKTFEGSYDDDTALDSDNGYNYDSSQVYYNGQLMNRSDMPSSDYNAPLTLTLNIQSTMFDDRLRINWMNRWKADAQGIMLDERFDNQTPNGTTSGSNTDASSQWVTDTNEYVQAYKEGKIKGGLISDIGIEYDILKDEHYTFGVSLDVYNIFNTDIGVSASDTGLSSEGTSFWFGIYAEF